MGQRRADQQIRRQPDLPAGIFNRIPRGSVPDDPEDTYEIGSEIGTSDGADDAEMPSSRTLVSSLEGSLRLVATNVIGSVGMAKKKCKQGNGNWEPRATGGQPNRSQSDLTKLACLWSQQELCGRRPAKFDPF